MKQWCNLALALGLAVSAGVQAGQVSMAGGSVGFSVPDNWVGIMETQGDPEAKVFQVPDPSPSASSTLARVTVTVKQVSDAAAFQDYVNAATAKAHALSGYQPAAGSKAGNDRFAYSAQENGTPFSYVERYWLKGDKAVQLRCVRPAASQAGAAWSHAFDEGCDQVASQLGR